MSKLVNEIEADTLMKPHLPILKTEMKNALDALNRSMVASGENWNNRAKCSAFHSIAIEKITRAFKDAPDVLIVPKYQSIQIVFGDKIVGRIKKLNKDNFTSNAKTTRNDLILSHQLSMFPELGPLTFVDIAYKVDSSWAEYDGLSVVCRLKDSLQWQLDFKDIALVVPMVERQEIVTPKPDESNIQIKKTKNK
ncbi:MAG: hypothetical protein WCF67_14380 [Chitinophagaceae bacterium]